MILKSPFTRKVLSSVLVGEIVVIPSHENGDIGVVLAQNPEFEQTLVACFRGSQGVDPYVDRFHNEEFCIVYGADWVLELTPRTTLNSNSEQSLAPGTISIGAGGTKLVLASNKKDKNLRGGHLDVSTLKISPAETNCVYTSEWKIWISEDDRDRTGSAPLIVHA